MPRSIAVVGAGVAGLSCARVLVDAGAQVTVFEQADEVGGRLASRRTELGGFDVGAQYFTRRDGEFGQAVDSWIEAGACAPWPARIMRLAATRGPIDERERLVGVPSMGVLAAHLAQGLDVRCQSRIRRLEAVGRGRPTRWTLKCAADPADLQSFEITEGIFDAVVVAVPPPASDALLESCPELSRASRGAQMQPCFALLMGFAEALELPYEGAFVEGHRLAWIARESSKPGRRPGERWVAHASYAWSLEHFDDDFEDIRGKLTKAFAETTGSHAQPIYASVFRWTHSAPTAGGGHGFLWNDEQRLGACGDWLSAPRVESAWLSGRALGQAALASLDQAR